MDYSTKTVQSHLDKWQKILRLQDWDIQLRMVETPWRKTGDIKIDSDDRKAVLMINGTNPKNENAEEVVIHELIHLKLWGMDQMIEHLISGLFGADETDPKHEFATTQFMMLLESTVEDLTKSYLSLGGENKQISFGRINQEVNAEINKGIHREQPHG